MRALAQRWAVRTGKLSSRVKPRPIGAKMLGYPTSYQCGDDLIITIGGAPTDFRMHISGEDAFYPIKLERIETEAKWTGAHGTLITQIEGNMETGYTFIRNGTEVVCQFYNHN